MIAYASRKLKPYENYSTHDLEQGAVVFALKLWRHYLYGATFKVFSDHEILKYIYTQKEFNMSSVACEVAREKQKGDPRTEKWRTTVEGGVASRFAMGGDDGLRFDGRWCVPDDEELQRKILTEAHSTPYFRVKGEHKRPQGKVQSLDVPEWKWESISMDFIVGLPRTQKGNNMIWIIIDRLTKTAHFIPMKETWSKAELAKAYVRNIVKLHGIPKDIVSDRDSRFISKFWEELQECMALYGTKCRSPVCWDDVTDAVTLGPETIQ
ncbi:uncharacterized protein LOC141632650 [Silene latifolia]|uniref:uncharacterized protein LOC141632650 n=1 Tax=Silene latifolia TaxID=37657 RepID=UPI003D787F01